MRVATTGTRLGVGLLAASFALAALPGAVAAQDESAAPSGEPMAAPSGEPMAAPSGEPIVVGSSLSLTGAFAPTGAIHKLAGDLFVERLNAGGGLFGRPVEWLVLDDESDQAQVASLYERLINQEGVDLIIGPYATPLILSASGVAERAGYVLPHHTSVLTPLMTYACQFPGWSIGPTPNEFVPGQLFDAVASLDPAPQRVVFVTNQSGSTDFITHGRADVEEANALTVAADRGLEVVADITYPPGTTEWSSVATQIRDANPDLVMMNDLGVESLGLLQAMEQLGYQPPIMFSLFPAPGPLLGAGEVAEGLLSVSMFESNDPILERLSPEGREIVEAFESAAAEAGLPYTQFDTQAAGSWTTWEILIDGVEAAGSTEDQQAICDALHESGAETTFNGHLTFDPAVNNYWPTTQGIKQIQDGEWVMVWPEERAAAPLRDPRS